MALCPMLQISKRNVTFLNRVPVRLAVTDRIGYSSVNSPRGVRGIGFSYSQHSKLCQLPMWAAGFCSLRVLQENSKLALASSVTHVNLMSGHQYLSCSASVFHRKDLGFRLLRRFFHRKLQGIENGFPRLGVGLSARKPESFFSHGNWQQIPTVNEHRPCQCHEF